MTHIRSSSWYRPLVCLFLSGALSVSLASTELQAQIEIDSDPRLTLGRGYHPARNEVAGDCIAFKEGDIETDYAQVVRYQLDVANSREKLRKLLNVSVEASVKYSIFGGGAKAEFQNGLSKHSFSMYGVVSATINSGSKRIRNPKLKEEYFELYKKNRQLFLEICGEEYISAITRGGQFYGVIELVTKSEIEKKKFEASINAYAGSYETSAKVKEVIEELKSWENIRVKVYIVGGRGIVVPDDLTGIKKAAQEFPKRILGLTEQKAVKSAEQKAVKSAEQKAVKSAEQKAVKSAEKKAVKSAEKDIMAFTSSYSTLLLSASWPPLLTHLHKRELNKLFNFFEDADQLIGDIQFILKHLTQFVGANGMTLTDSDRSNLEAKLKQLRKIQHKLITVIERCVKVPYQTPEQSRLLESCVLPNDFIFPNIVLPKRKTENGTVSSLQNEISEFIKSVGREPNAKWADNNGWTDLHYAALLNLSALAQHIVELRKKAKRPINPHLVTSGTLSQDLLNSLNRIGWNNANVESARVGQTPLHIAAQENSAAFLETVLNSGLSIHVKDSVGQNALHYAAAQNAKDAVLVLTGRAKNLATLRDSRGDIPAYKALMRGHAEIARILLDSSNIKLESLAKTHALLNASKNGYLEVVRFLWNERNVSVGNQKYERRPLHLAVQYGHFDVARFFVENTTNLNSADASGFMPLHLAAISGRLNMIELLIDKGADIEVGGRNNKRPLHLAAKYGRINSVRLLAKKGADINAKDKHEWRPLHWAVWMGHLDIVKLLLAKTAKVEVSDKNGWRPLHLAAWRGWLDIIKFLHEKKGAKINVKDNIGAQPLHWAVEQSNLAVVRYLLENGVDIEAQDQFDRRPLHWTISHSRQPDIEILLRDLRRELGPLHNTEDNAVNMIRFLLKRGAQLEVSDEIGRRPLHLAAMKNFSHFVKLLLEKGAQINASDNGGWSPLHLATYHGRLVNVRYLLQQGADACALSRGGVSSMDLVNKIKLNQKSISSLLNNYSRKCK